MERKIDLEFYNREIAPMLPPKVLDFHTHTWSADNWKEKPWDTGKAGGKYMVTDEYYPPEQLLKDGADCFPDREYNAVCFGYPTPAVDWEKDTAYVAKAAAANKTLFPLMVAGPDLKISRARYERALDEGRFYGIKVFLNWYGDNYGKKKIEEMFGPDEIAVANERRLVIMLHVPRSGRLVDPEVQAGVRWLSKECPDGQIVLAHGGRCYVPAEMKAAVGSIAKLSNVCMDLSMVMDPVCVQLALREIGPGRLLFATDFPPARMWGRRVCVKDHWVDVVLGGYPDSAFRVASDGIHACSMVWEMALAIRWAAELTGTSAKEVHGIFWGNGMRLLKGTRTHGQTRTNTD